MKKNSIVGLIFLFAGSITARSTSFMNSYQPRFSISIITINQNKIKGLYLYSRDTTVTLYPGTATDWKAGKNFEELNIPASNIHLIQLKKRNGFLKKMFVIAGKQDNLRRFQLKSGAK